jgi:hypothetical protein
MRADRARQFEEFAEACQEKHALHQSFVEQVRSKREVGEETYGDASYGWRPEQLLKEVLEECIDVMGWSSILYVATDSARLRERCIRWSVLASYIAREIEDEIKKV